MVIDSHTLFLLIGMINASLIFGLLVFRKNNRPANVVLASFTLLLVMRVLVYILGRDGVYDPHSWLYQPPIEFSLGYGPLIYAYVSLLTGQFNKSLWLHALPLFFQVCYYLTLLSMPDATAVNWIQHAHLNYIIHIESFLVIVSMSVYLIFSWRSYSAYLVKLKQQRSDVENFRLPWLFGFLLSTSITMAIIACYAISALWLAFNYSQHFWLFASQSVLLFYLSIESWKHGDKKPPNLTCINLRNTTSDAERTKQYQQQAELWLQTINSNRWWQDPELTLQTLAKKLGSNTTTVSKVINSGLKKNFNTLINELRIAAVRDCIDQGLASGMILKTAFSMGFNSKNSFNRNFKLITGYTPQQYQQLKVPNHKSLN